jgi:hypothetical protein
VASSPVTVAFRGAVAAGLKHDGRVLREAIGRVPEIREMARALLLAHRATVTWAGEAIALTNSATSNALTALARSSIPRPGPSYSMHLPGASRRRPRTPVTSPSLGSPLG